MTGLSPAGIFPAALTAVFYYSEIVYRCQDKQNKEGEEERWESKRTIEQIPGSGFRSLGKDKNRKENVEY